jgi:hypothetical protein
MRAYYNLIEGLWRLGEYPGALRYLEAAEDFGRDRDFRVYGYMFAARRGRLALMRGRWAEAEAWLGAGDPYERAVELAGSGQVEPALEELTALDGLGAKPAAAIVRSRGAPAGGITPDRGPPRLSRPAKARRAHRARRRGLGRRRGKRPRVNPRPAAREVVTEGGPRSVRETLFMPNGPWCHSPHTAPTRTWDRSPGSEGHPPGHRSGRTAITSRHIMTSVS